MLLYSPFQHCDVLERTIVVLLPDRRENPRRPLLRDRVLIPIDLLVRDSFRIPGYLPRGIVVLRQASRQN